MGQRAHDTITIDAPPERVMAVITDLERYPEWTEEIQKVEVLATDDQGRPVQAAFTVDAKVVEVRYTLEYSHRDNQMSWHLVEGEVIRQLDGSYVVEPRDGRVEVTYTLEGDVDLPLPNFMKERATQRILDQGLVGLKERVEGMA